MDRLTSLTAIHRDRVERIGGRCSGVAVATVVRPATELRARSPRTVTEPEGIDGDGLAPQPDRALVSPGLIEMRRTEVVRRRDRGEGEIDVQFVAVGIVVAQLVARQRLEAAVVDAVGQGDVRQRLVGNGQVPEVLGVEAVPRLVALVVPEVRAARRDSLIRAEERIELPRQPALGHGEREPTRLGPIGVVVGRGMELVVGMGLGHSRLLASRSKGRSGLPGAVPTISSMSTVTLLPLSGTLGAEVAGVDVCNVDEPMVGRLCDLLAEHHLLLFRNQDLTPREHAAFAGQFGPLSVHPRLRAIDEAPELIEVYDPKNPVATTWHQDQTFLRCPPSSTMLVARVLPPSGGDTMFANQHAAFDALSPAMQEIVVGLRAVHRRVARDSEGRVIEHDEATHPIAPGASRHRPPRPVRQPRLHRRGRRLHAIRKRRAARVPLCTLGAARIHLPPSVGHGRCRVVGQPQPVALRRRRRDRSPAVAQGDDGRRRAGLARAAQRPKRF